MSRNWWPALISRTSSTARDGYRVCFAKTVPVACSLFAGRARRTSLTNGAPECSSPPKCCAVRSDHTPPTTYRVAPTLAHGSRRPTAGPGHLPDPGAIVTPAPRFSSTGFYLACSRSPSLTIGSPLSGAGQIESFTSLSGHGRPQPDRGRELVCRCRTNKRDKWPEPLS